MVLCIFEKDDFLFWVVGLDINLLSFWRLVVGYCWLKLFFCVFFILDFLVIVDWFCFCINVVGCMFLVVVVVIIICCCWWSSIVICCCWVVKGDVIEVCSYEYN